MRLTPDDLATRVFSKKLFGGYDKKEVCTFLEKVYVEWNKILKEQTELKNKIQQQARQLADYQDREGLLRETITTAQKTAARMQEDASGSAKQTIEDARHKADLIVQDARDSLKTVYQDLSNLRRVHIQMKNTLKAVLQSHQDLLEQDPVHTLLPQMSQDENDTSDIEEKVSDTLNELSKTKELL